jgi:hypothetical protein
MNNTNTGGPAYPAPTTKPLENYYPGMTLRDYFAAKAMQGFAADPDTTGPAEVIAKVAYEWADAMLRAREAT